MTLTEYLRTRQVDLGQALQLGLGLLDGLSSLHRRGLVHRDVNPNNVLVDHTGAALCDFGLALALGRTTQDRAAGTPGFVAPELDDDGTAPSYRSDVYSAAQTISRMIGPGAPAAVDQLVTAVAGSSRAQDRPADAMDFARRLRALVGVDGQPPEPHLLMARTDPQPDTRPSGLPGAPVAPLPAGTSGYPVVPGLVAPVPRPSRSRSVGLAVIAVIAVATITAVGLPRLFGGPQRTRTDLAAAGGPTTPAVTGNSTTAPSASSSPVSSVSLVPPVSPVSPVSLVPPASPGVAGGSAAVPVPATGSTSGPTTARITAPAQPLPRSSSSSAKPPAPAGASTPSTRPGAPRPSTAPASTPQPTTQPPVGNPFVLPDVGPDGKPQYLAFRQSPACTGVEQPKVMISSPGGVTFGVVKVYLDTDGTACAKFAKWNTTPLYGNPSYLAISLCNAHGRCDHDWSEYKYDAGPIRVAADGCLRWRISAMDLAGFWLVRDQFGATGC